MIVERVEIPVLPGQEEALLATLEQWRDAIQQADGCHSVAFGRGVENPSKVLILVEWDAVASHTAVSQSDAGVDFVNQIVGFFGGAPSLEHFEKA